MSDTPTPEIRHAACPRCGGALKKLWSGKRERHYWFCAAASDECGAIYPDRDGEPWLRQVSKSPIPDMICPGCGRPSLERVEGGRYGPYLLCAECAQSYDLQDQDAPAGAGNLAPLCSADPRHGHMRRRSGRNGPFWGCRQYPTCRATATIPEVQS